MSNEVITAALGFLTILVGILAGAVGTLWRWVDARVVACEKDRLALSIKIDTDRLAYASKVEELTKRIIEMSATLGRVDSHLEFIDKRHDDDKPK